MSPTYPSTRKLPDRPDLIQLKRQAKELLKDFAAGDPVASAEVHAHFHGARLETFALHDAQLVLARVYGFASWTRLKAYVDGVTVRRFAAAARAGDLEVVRSMVAVRPELVNLDIAEDDEHQALHHAVLARQPEIVRCLVQHGANPRKGIWPHRDATSPLTMAIERGYTDIVDIISAEERRHPSRPSTPPPAVPSELMDAFQRGDEEAMIVALDTRPALIHASEPQTRMTLLHWAAANLWEQLAAWLLDRGADVHARTISGQTPLGVLGAECDSRAPQSPRLLRKLADMLVARGAERTARWAIATGDAAWLRAHCGGGEVAAPRRLLTHAVTSDRADMLALLLDLGLDPDERERVAGLEEVVHSWGAPLRQCAIASRPAMAAMLLKHGATPNTHVYAASTAMYEAYVRRDREMVELLERHGGFVDAGTAGYLGLADRARQLFEDEAMGRLPEGLVSPDSSVAEELLFSAAASGNVDLVQMALDHLDWAPGDVRWQWRLMQPLGRHAAAERERYLACFRMILRRSGVDLPYRFGRTLLHDVAAAWPRSAPMGEEDRISFATILLDAGARLDLRDDLLRSTPLGWACRWGRVELVTLLLMRGADPIEVDAEPWATPRAWAEKMKHAAVLSALRRHTNGHPH